MCDYGKPAEKRAAIDDNESAIQGPAEHVFILYRYAGRVSDLKGPVFYTGH